ncbi:MAG: hypothetical protein OXC30_03930 [Alphaproteobacteria bacterium]|nr:hypothetical protein [Alphaproteobacteria bacterium]
MFLLILFLISSLLIGAGRNVGDELNRTLDFVPNQDKSACAVAKKQPLLPSPGKSLAGLQVRSIVVQSDAADSDLMKKGGGLSVEDIAKLNTSGTRKLFFPVEDCVKLQESSKVVAFPAFGLRHQRDNLSQVEEVWHIPYPEDWIKSDPLCLRSFSSSKTTQDLAEAKVLVLEVILMKDEIRLTVVSAKSLEGREGFYKEEREWLFNKHAHRFQVALALTDLKIGNTINIPREQTRADKMRGWRPGEKSDDTARVQAIRRAIPDVDRVLFSRPICQHKESFVSEEALQFFFLQQIFPHLRDDECMKMLDTKQNILFFVYEHAQPLLRKKEWSFLNRSKYMVLQNGQMPFKQTSTFLISEDVSNTKDKKDPESIVEISPKIAQQSVMPDESMILCVQEEIGHLEINGKDVSFMQYYVLCNNDAQKMQYFLDWIDQKTPDGANSYKDFCKMALFLCRGLPYLLRYCPFDAEWTIFKNKWKGCEGVRSLIAAPKLTDRFS